MYHSHLDQYDINYYLLQVSSLFGMTWEYFQLAREHAGQMIFVMAHTHHA